MSNGFVDATSKVSTIKDQKTDGERKKKGRERKESVRLAGLDLTY